MPEKPTEIAVTSSPEPRSHDLNLLQLVLAENAASIGSKEPAPADPSPSRFDDVVEQYREQDTKQHIGDKETVFFGSSSIARWNSLEDDFRTDDALNRGINGSMLRDLDYDLNELVLKHHPHNIVLYAGTNDLMAGHSPEQVLQDLEQIEHDIHAKLPDAELYFVSPSLPPTAIGLKDNYERADELTREYISSTPNCEYIDVTPDMQDAQHNPRPELFGNDHLHMTPAGYAIWKRDITAALHEHGPFPPVPEKELPPANGHA